jgi:hypothetical protein
MRRSADDLRRSRRIRILELVVITVVAAAVAALAIPAFAAKARQTVLHENGDTLALQLRSHLVLDEDPCALEADLQRDLRSGELGSFVNPYSGSAEILCDDDVREGTAPARPAVLFTSDQRYARAALKTSATTVSELAGTLIVCLVTRDGALTADVGFVRADGTAAPCASVSAAF